MAKQYLKNEDAHGKPGMPDPGLLEAEERQRRYRFCTGKHAFATKAEADQAIPMLTKKWKLRGAWLESYECPYCRKYHVGRNYNL